ncbi:uncharacterized protein LOC124823055 [Vigna umbellata]|uniref:uncharacterized protein LOC124823055 n=1 Tax=Vigna umbellata TaxID=87088 RepID=UPI001F5EFB90|nr:uncharacterized protein LOC124823055 [Vigna umbellata]XP_047151137.1 uncharacterized protein LOC124823055 [Vigna umbellata]
MKERRRHNTVRAVATLPPQGFHLRHLCKNSYSFPQIPPGSKIKVLQMGKGEEHFAFLLLRRYGEDGGVAMDGSLRSSRLKLMVVLARKKRTRLRQWRLGWRRLNQGGVICFLVLSIEEDELANHSDVVLGSFMVVWLRSGKGKRSGLYEIRFLKLGSLGFLF